MTTVLKRFKDAYATMTVAVYEPLVVQWYSVIGIKAVVEHTIDRVEPIKVEALVEVVPQPGPGLIRRLLPPEIGELLAADQPLMDLLNQPGVTFVNRETNSDIEFFHRFPLAEIENGILYPRGRAATAVPDSSGGQSLREDPIPLLVRPTPLGARRGVDVLGLREELSTRLSKELADAVTADAADDVVMVKFATSVHEYLLANNFKAPFELFPVEGSLQEFLSPIGVAHFYRQLYYHLDEGVGPIEHAFTVAPKETLEIVLETVRRQSHEEITEYGSETISESATESKNLDEVSDKVATLVERDSSSGMSASATFSAGGNIGVWQASASASIGGQSTLSNSSSTSNEIAKRKLKEVTKRASERITKSFSLRVRDTTDYTTTTLTRRTVENQSAEPISYGLRRVFNRVRVQVQDLGPCLVWQLYLREPASGLARSQFVHFSAYEPRPTVGDPPAVRARPTGGTDSGNQSSTIKYSVQESSAYVTIAVNPGPDRTIQSLSIESITDLEHLAKEDLAPSPQNSRQWGAATSSNGTYSVNIAVLPGDAYSVSVSYTYTWQPSPAVIAEWEAERKTAANKFAAMEAEAREKALREDFERQRTLITLRSKVRPRPSSDLRREERYEILNRMISHLFRPTVAVSSPSPLEIELFSRYFDTDAMFIYTHSSWWRPRYPAPNSGIGRSDYAITNESDPAALGSSIGWLLQLDGDARRNEFLNSPWVRVCIPIRSGRERAAVAWLAKHLEGDIGYDASKDPLKTLLQDFESRRKSEMKVQGEGPDYITVDSTVGAPGAPLKPVEQVYPVIDVFESTLPTEGFVYDELEVKIP